MGIDPTDNSREESRRVDEKRLDSQKDKLKNKSSQDFSARYQSFLQSREKNKPKTDSKDETGKGEQKKEARKSEENIFSRVMEVFQARDKQHEDKKEAGKKDELKKEDRPAEENPTEPKTKAQDGHQRIESTHSRREGGGQGGQGESGGGMRHNLGGRSGGDAGGSGSHEGFGQKTYKEKTSSVTGVKGHDSSGSHDSNSQGGRFTPQVLDTVVQSVFLHVGNPGEEEMEIHLADHFFKGLKLKVKKTTQGVLVVFICPSREVRNTFLLHRPQLYSRLKEKGLSVSRIEIEG